MAFKFLQIGKANAEIDRLNAELAKVTKERDEALAASDENASEVVKQAEQIQSDLATAKQTISSLTTERDALAGQVSAKDAEIKDLKGQLEAKDGEVKIKVAQQVQSIQAGLGAPPVPTPATKTGNTNGAKPPTGMARVLESCREDLKKAGYVHPSQR